MNIEQAKNIIITNYPKGSHYYSLRCALTWLLDQVEKDTSLSIEHLDTSTMNLQEAKEIITEFYPPERYTMIREALNWLIQQVVVEEGKDLPNEQNN